VRDQVSHPYMKTGPWNKILFIKKHKFCDNGNTS
jgi:hypothetical protein